MTCALCGLDFDAADALCAHGCPLAGACGLVQCPGCAFEFPAGGESERGLRRKRNVRRVRAAGGIRTVLDLEPGERATVLCFGDGRGTRRNALAVFGLVPGATVRLLQRRSCPVIEVGETTLALDHDIAAAIVVGAQQRG